MKIDTRDAWITRMKQAGPNGFREILSESLNDITGKIMHIFDDMSAIDIPLMIVACRQTEKALANSMLAKETNVARVVNEFCAMIGIETTEIIVSAPKDPGDSQNEE